VKTELKVVYSPAQLSARIAQMGRAISRDYAGRTLDVVAILEDAFVFAADLLRHIACPVVCHFVHTETHEVKLGGYDRKEIFISHEPDLAGRDVLLVDAVLRTGVTLDFMVKRLLESQPRSLRVAVLLDKPQERRVDIKPDYFGFVAASNYLVGYGLSGSRGLHRNLPYIGQLDASRQPVAVPRPRAGTKRRGKGSKK